MSTKMTTEIDAIDMIKFERLAKKAGMTSSQAARIIAKSGVAFFLAKVVGATAR